MKILRLVTLLLPLALPVVAATPVVDGHDHEGLFAAGGVIDVTKLAELRARGIDVVVVPLPIDRSPATDLVSRITSEIGWLRDAARSETFRVVDDPSALVDGLPDDRIGLLFSIEWFRGTFNGRAETVKAYSDLGVRAVSLVERDPDGIFAADDPTMLTPFGEEIIAALNAHKVLIDITHLSHAQKLTVIAASSQPVVATHSLVRAVVPSDFNLPDEVLDALAKHGGSAWVSFQKEDVLGDAPDERAVEMLVRHIRVLVDRLGAGHVGIGTDLQAGGKYIPASLNGDDVFVRIREAMVEAGFDEETIRQVLGGNVLRVMDTSNLGVGR